MSAEISNVMIAAWALNSRPDSSHDSPSVWISQRLALQLFWPVLLVLLLRHECLLNTAPTLLTRAMIRGEKISFLSLFPDKNDVSPTCFCYSAVTGAWVLATWRSSVTQKEEFWKLTLADPRGCSCFACDYEQCYHHLCISNSFSAYISFGSQAESPTSTSVVRS